MRTLVRAAAGSSTAQAFASDKEELQRRTERPSICPFSRQETEVAFCSSQLESAQQATGSIAFILFGFASCVGTPTSLTLTNVVVSGNETETEEMAEGRYRLVHFCLNLTNSVVFLSVGFAMALQGRLPLRWRLDYFQRERLYMVLMVMFYVTVPLANAYRLSKLLSPETPDTQVVAFTGEAKKTEDKIAQLLILASAAIVQAHPALPMPPIPPPLPCPGTHAPSRPRLSPHGRRLTLAARASASASLCSPAPQAPPPPLCSPTVGQRPGAPPSRS
jgi:hypothetical protein